MKRLSTAVFPGIAASGAILSGVFLIGCSAGTTGGLQQPSLQQPGSGMSGDSRSAAVESKATEDALKAPRVGVFLTSSKGKQSGPAYAHVWAPILKVEFVDDKGGAETIWDGGADGTVVDLVPLAGDGGPTANNRFLALTGASVTSGKATEKVRVTFGKSFEIYPVLTNIAQTALIADSVARDAEGRPVMSFPLTKPRNLGTGKDNIVLDFDLATLAIKDEKVTPTLRDGDTTGLTDLARQAPTTFTGTVSGLTSAAADSRFVLTPEGAGTAVVQTSDSTLLFNDDAAPSPAIVDKKRVRVTGILSPDTKRFLAEQVSAFSGDKAASPASALTGSVSHADSEARTFTIGAAQVEGLTPTQATIVVTLAPDAVLRSRSGLLLTPDIFWAALKVKGASPLARVEGTFDPVNGTLTATRAKLENVGRTTTHDADVEGSPKFVDIGAQTFTLATPLARWDGIVAPGEKSKGIPVSVTAATEFRNGAGEFVARDHFFKDAVASKDKVVRVFGAYSAKGAMVATRVELRDKPAPVASASPATGVKPPLAEEVKAPTAAPAGAVAATATTAVDSAAKALANPPGATAVTSPAAPTPDK